MNISGSGLDILNVIKSAPTIFNVVDDTKVQLLQARSRNSGKESIEKRLIFCTFNQCSIFDEDLPIDSFGWNEMDLIDSDVLKCI